MHRTLCKAFGNDKNTWKEARVLFRVDDFDEGRRLRALVQSTVEPDWNAITVSDDYLVTEIQCKRVAPVLRIGQRLAFRIRANPTVKLKCDDRPNGMRQGIYDETERLAWLGRKGERSGFRVLEARVASDGKQRGTTASGYETVFAAAVFEGVLEVTEAAALRASLESGIGSAKGFGFGLLSVAPVRGW